MAKNKLSTNFKANPDKDKWNKICPAMEYRVITGFEAYSLGIAPTGMKDINSVAILASGSTDSTIMYIANYFRIDRKEIDQEPYFELYVSGSTLPNQYGIFHHADFSGRTETLNKIEYEKIVTSGSMAEIQFTAKPENNSGTLEELRTQGKKILGFEYAWVQGNNAWASSAE